MNLSLISKSLITFGVVFYLLVIPYLEWNSSHVFNDGWPAHARFHEVWQLTTNMMLGVVALFLVYKRNQIIMAGVLSCCVMSGVVVSHLISDRYGGSVISGNISKQILGLDLAVFVALIVVITALAAIFLELLKQSRQLR